MSPKKYYNRSSLVSRFPEGFARLKIEELTLEDGKPYKDQSKKSSEDEIISSSFGVISVMLNTDIKPGMLSFGIKRC